MSIHVGGAGLQTTIQDLGRPAHQREGIPAGGAMDRLAHRVANLLVGNDEHAATLEAALMGPTLTFDEETLIAVAGGDLEPSVAGQAIPHWRPVRVAAGATLRFGRAGRGCRAYIAVGGGIAARPVFGSRSTYLRASFGGFDGRALRAGDVLATETPGALAARILSTLRADGDKPVAATWGASPTLRPRYSSEPTIRLIEGAHTNELAPASRAALVEQRFRVSASSDRMGYRLEGPTLSLAAPREMLSEGVAFGTMQLPPGGAPIVLMADRQTTGGYPRIGEVASVDLPLVAQLKPGDQARFRFISLADAQRLYLALEQDLTQAKLAIALRHPAAGRA